VVVALTFSAEIYQSASRAAVTCQKQGQLVAWLRVEGLPANLLKQ
jgi:hypothetical protein